MSPSPVVSVREFVVDVRLDMDDTRGDGATKGHFVQRHKRRLDAAFTLEVAGEEEAFGEGVGSRNKRLDEVVRFLQRWRR